MTLGKASSCARVAKGCGCGSEANPRLEMQSVGVLTDLAGFLSSVAWATEDGDGRVVGGAEADLGFTIWLPTQ